MRLKETIHAFAQEQKETHMFPALITFTSKFCDLGPVA